jgi:hypothetical protein
MMDAFDAELARLEARAHVLERLLEATRAEVALYRENAWRETTRAQQLETALVKTEAERDACRHALRRVFDLGCKECTGAQLATAALMKVRQGVP